MIDTIQAFCWHLVYTLFVLKKKLHYNNANSVLKLNNNYNLTNSDIFIHIYMRRHYNYDYILIIIFKYYPFIDLVQMYYDFTKYIVLWNYAVKCNLESRNATIL